MARSTRPMGLYKPPNKSGDTRPSKRTRRTASAVGGRKAVRSTYGQPPVLVRNDASALPVDRRRRTTARRRYDVALGSHGAELRLPSLPQVRLSWRLLSLLLVAVLAGAIYAVWTAPEFRVQAVEIQGLVRLTAADITTVLTLEDQPIFAVSPAKLTQDLQEAFPEITGVSVKVDLPASVMIKLEERQPVLAIRLEGEEIWVDEEGISFPARGDTGPLPAIEVSDLAVLGGSDGETDQNGFDPQMVQAILVVASYLPSGQSLVLDEEHGLGWSDERGWQAYFGFKLEDSSEMEMKLKVYEALVQRLEEKGVWPQLISVEFLHAPYYRLE
jgi:cell division protein FtsQ